MSRTILDKDVWPKSQSNLSLSLSLSLSPPPPLSLSLTHTYIGADRHACTHYTASGPPLKLDEVLTLRLGCPRRLSIQHCIWQGGCDHSVASCELLRLLAPKKRRTHQSSYFISLSQTLWSLRKKGKEKLRNKKERKKERKKEEEEEEEEERKKERKKERKRIREWTSFAHKRLGMIQS